MIDCLVLTPPPPPLLPAYIIQVHCTCHPYIQSACTELICMWGDMLLLVVLLQYISIGMGKVFHPGKPSGDDDVLYSWSPEGLPYYHCESHCAL